MALGLSVFSRHLTSPIRSNTDMIWRRCFPPNISLLAGISEGRARAMPGTAGIVRSRLVSGSRHNANMITGDCLAPDISLRAFIA
jgi:hypothetical protein